MKTLLVVSCFVAVALAKSFPGGPLPTSSWLECPRTGLAARPDPSSCSRYFACNNGVSEAKACDEGLHYSHEESACVQKEAAKCNLCDYNTRTIKFLPVEDSCNKYQMCFGREHIELECGNGLLFNHHSQACDRQANVDCQRSRSNALIASLTNACPRSNRISFLPDTQSCQHYIICDNGQSELQDCGQGKIFNIDLNSCSNTGRCILDYQPKCPNSGALTAVPHPYDCRHFFWCDNGDGILDVCNSGQLFNINSGRCDPENIARCAKP